jgi:hypothetical protein
MKITMEFARQDDCLDKMVPSDLRQLIGDKERAEEQCKALAAQVEAITKTLEKFGWFIGTMREYEEIRKVVLDTSPTACLAQVRAEAVLEAVKFFHPSRDIDVEALESYAKRIRQEVR